MKTEYEVRLLEFDLATCSLIPTYLEIEGGNSKSIYDVITKLGYQQDDFTTMGVVDIYNYYKIDVEFIEN